MPAGIPFIDPVTGRYLYQGTSGTPGVLATADGYVPFQPLYIEYPIVSGYQSTSSASYSGVGAVSFDPSVLFSGNSKIIRSLVFQTIIESTTGVTSRVRLFNLTTSLPVTGTELSTSANTPTLLSTSLTVGGNLASIQQLYEVQLQITVPVTPTTSDRAVCKSGSIKVSWI